MLTPMTGISHEPIDRTVLARAKLELWDGWMWVVPKCPFCKRQHAHGGGQLDENPFRLLGHRRSHCVHPHMPPGGRGTYKMVLDEEARKEAEALIAGVEKTPAYIRMMRIRRSAERDRQERAEAAR